MRKLLFLFVFLWASSTQAYPWMFFRENPSSRFQVDGHVSYFLKNKLSGFVGSELAYHNPKIDIDLGYNYAFLEKNHYFRLSELSVIFPFLFENWKMSLGIKDILWSEADRYWNYGLWQARYLLDPLRPKQMGRPGLYFDYEINATSFLVSLSYFHIPDVIILPKLKNSKIISDNPFFINSFGNEFNWNVKELDPFKINRFFKPSLAFRLKHSIEKTSINLSYAYKPVNQFKKAVSIKGANLSESKSEALTVTDFKYSIVSHHLASLEFETKLTKNVSLFASAFWEQPEQTKSEKSWISDNFSSQVTYSLIAYFQEQWEEELKTLFTIGWTKTVDSSLSDTATNPILSEYKEIFNRAFDWKSAISASIEHENKQIYKGLLFRFRTNYSLDNQIYQFIFENYLYFTPQIRLYLSGDFFYRFSKTLIPNNSSAIKQYKGLSRLLLGAQYVF